MSKLEETPFNPFDVSNLIISNFIRYERLFNITKYAFYGDADKIDTINIFIDMPSITRCLYSLGNFIPNPAEIAACMINLCAHLKEFFQNRLRTHCRIFIVYGTNRPSPAVAEYPDYNIHYAELLNAKKFITKSINDSLELLTIITPYLKDIYFIQDKNILYEPEVSSIISSLIDIYGLGYPNIIYSKDRYTYQLVAIKPMTFVFRPKKHYGDDRSFVVTKSTLYKRFRKDSYMKDLTFDISDLSPELFSLMLAMCGFNDRHIPCTFGNEIASSSINNTAALYKLKKAVDNRRLINGYNSHIYDIYNTLKINPALSDLFEHRYRAVDLVYQTSLYESNPCYKAIGENIVDLYDPKGIQELNNKYFMMYPMDLNRL